MTKTLPTQPLWDYLLARSGLPERQPGDDSAKEGFGIKMASEMLRVDRSGLGKLFKRGTITEKRADEFAVRVGTLPHVIWGETWFDLDRDFLEGRDPRVSALVEEAMKEIGRQLRGGSPVYHVPHGRETTSGMGPG